VRSAAGVRVILRQDDQVGTFLVVDRADMLTIVFAAMNSRRFIIRSGDRQPPGGVARRSVDGYQKR
jgi:hypothetical protein